VGWIGLRTKVWERATEVNGGSEEVGNRAKAKTAKGSEQGRENAKKSSRSHLTPTQWVSVPNAAQACSPDFFCSLARIGVPSPPPSCCPLSTFACAKSGPLSGEGERRDGAHGVTTPYLTKSHGGRSQWMANGHHGFGMLFVFCFCADCSMGFDFVGLSCACIFFGPFEAMVRGLLSK
jgi:hypothetical protein